jgi:hypothetical protein
VRSIRPASKARRGEFPRLGDAAEASLEGRADHRLDHGGAAVDVEFGHILAGIGVGRRHPEDEGFVDEAALGVLEGANHGAARLREGLSWIDRRERCFT